MLKEHALKQYQIWNRTAKQQYRITILRLANMRMAECVTRSKQEIIVVGPVIQNER
jgi:hypothetical protein